MIFCICAEGILFILFRCKNVLSNSLSVLLGSSLCLCFLFEDHVCPVSWSQSLWNLGWRHIPITNEDADGHYRNHSWDERPQRESMCYSHSFFMKSSTFLAIFWLCSFVQMKNGWEGAVFKMQIWSHHLPALSGPHSPNFPTYFFNHLLLVKGLCLYHLLCLECSPHPSSLVTNFLTILAISVQAYLCHRICLDLHD